MNIFIFGANGQIGKRLVDRLLEDGKHTVTVGLRKEEQFPYFEKKQAKPVLVNLEDTVESISGKLENMDAVVFTAGSGGGTGADKTLLIDLDGAIKTIEAAEQANVNHYVMVSAFGAGDRSTWNEEIKPYYVAKYYADQALENSSLNYTIIRPGALTNDPGKGTVSFDNQDDFHISRDDVASVIAEVIGRKNSFRKAVNLLPGNVPVKELAENI